MHRIIIILLGWAMLSLFSIHLQANNLPLDSLYVTSDSITEVSKPPSSAGKKLILPELDAQLIMAPDTTGNEDDLTSLLTQIGDGGHLASVTRAREIVNNALGVGRFIQLLDSLAFQEFPVIIADTIGNVFFTLVFDDFRIYPEYAQLEVILKMDIPQKKVGADGNQTLELYFGSPNIKFSYGGGLIGETKLQLYGDVAIGSGNDSKFGFILKAAYTQGSGANAQELGTYAKIDCDGFVEMGVEAEVLFSRDWIIPVNSQGTPSVTGRVTGSIQTIINDWNNLLIDFSIPNFALKAYDDLAFNISHCVLDFSDYRNSPNVVFPQAYAEQNLLPDNPNLWRGVYIKNLEVMLPRQFKDKDCVATGSQQSTGGMGQILLDEQGEFALSWEPEPVSSGPSPSAVKVPLRPAAAPEENCRITIGVNDLLIDKLGVSGHFYANDVLDLNKGSMSGWRFSVNNISVEIVTSEVTGFGFGGEVGIPIAKKTEPFAYDAFVNIPNKSYNFSLTIQSNMSFPVFQMGTVNIDSSSTVQITSTPSRFIPVAILYGSASISAYWKNSGEPADGGSGEPGKKIFEVAALQFNGLRLATASPYLSLTPTGSLGFSSGLKLVNFPISISDPKLTSLPGNKVKFGVNIEFNMMSQTDGGFAATTKVGLVGELKTEEEYKTWKYDRFQVDSIAVIIDIDPLYLEGSIYIFRDDPVFGKGFQGSLYANIMDGKFELTANAIFGKVGYKYWYFDAMVESSLLKIPIFPPAIYINGFGGGAYHHMKMAAFEGSGTGTTSSGVKYVPNDSVKLGLKAIVAFTSDGDTVDGIATLEIVFGAGMSLQEIMFYGRAEIVSPKVNALAAKFSANIGDRLDKLPLTKAQAKQQDDAATSSPNNAILASLFLRMNFEDGFEFQGTFRVKLNAANGVVVGEGAIDLLLSVPQNKWHLYIGGYSNGAIYASDGAPLYPVGVTLYYANDPDNPNDDLVVSAGAYFLTGNDIPGPPPLEPRAAAFFGSSGQNNNRSEVNGQAAQGTGFAFGAFAFIDFEYVKEYRNNGNKKKWVHIQAGLGFDISLLKYQENTYCSLSGTSPHGMKGWRATGRIWAFVDVVGGKWGWVPVPNLGIGVLLEADVPKPSYFRGQLRVKFGPFNIPVTVKIGKECGQPFVG